MYYQEKKIGQNNKKYKALRKYIRHYLFWNIYQVFIMEILPLFGLLYIAAGAHGMFVLFLYHFSLMPLKFHFFTMIKIICNQFSSLITRHLYKNNCKDSRSVFQVKLVKSLKNFEIQVWRLLVSNMLDHRSSWNFNGLLRMLFSILKKIFRSFHRFLHKL